jgi:hypothetical protein
MTTRRTPAVSFQRCAFHIFSMLVVLLIAGAVSCRRPSQSATGPIAITLHPAQSSAVPAYVEVTAVSAEAIRSLRSRPADDPAWTDLLRVTVGEDPGLDSVPPVQGRYEVRDEAIRFTPLFPFDPGRSYAVRFDPRKLPTPDEHPVVTSVVRLAPVATEPSTVVTAIHPAADLVPENLLRIYVEFSAPMGSGVGLNYVRLLERIGGEAGERVVEGTFLPVEANFWNPDHTRYTLFFDPGRVKEGVFPNRQVGRPLRAGHQYVFEVEPTWTDANGLPLKTPFRHEFRAGPAIDKVIAFSEWTIRAPSAGTRDPVVVMFDRPLDHGIVVRALGIETPDGRRVAGDGQVGGNDTQWTFTPAAAWMGGGYQLVAQSYLEDPEGNRIDQPFEVYEKANTEPAPEAFRKAFTIEGSEPPGSLPKRQN